MTELRTKIGLEIHVQLATKSKMFCGCDNDAQGKEPNTVVCPVCLGLPGALPVANEQAILSTIKTGLALNCEIKKIAKFDRKHYFYPDLPKGYQISQYDEPFCQGGEVEIDGLKVRLNRIHLEEDAGKLIHRDGKSLVDLNRAGTPLMEIVTEPDITTPAQAGEFLRQLQKIVRDIVKVSEASMEKGHMRCDANISVNDGERMSPIIEIKNINSFRFVEKALTLAEEKLKAEIADWPDKNSKETWGYDSENNKVYLQRRKEESADYRYFPEPDLPPIDTTKFNLEELRSDIGETGDQMTASLTEAGVSTAEAQILVSDKQKRAIFELLSIDMDEGGKAMAAKVVVHNYFGFSLSPEDNELMDEYRLAIKDLAGGKIQKNIFSLITSKIHNEKIKYEDAKIDDESGNLEAIIDQTLAQNKTEVDEYRNGKTQLFGFFVGQVMRECKGSANPQEINRILKEKL